MVKAEGSRPKIKCGSGENAFSPVHDKSRIVGEKILKMKGIVVEQVGRPCSKDSLGRDEYWSVSGGDPTHSL